MEIGLHCGKNKVNYYEGEIKNKLVVYTRVGRQLEVYSNEVALLKKHENFVRTFEDETDHTYLYFEFNIPEILKNKMEQTRPHIEKIQDARLVGKKFSDLNRKMKSKVKDSEIDQAMTIGKKIFSKFEEGKGGIIEV